MGLPVSPALDARFTIESGCVDLNRLGQSSFCRGCHPSQLCGKNRIKFSTFSGLYGVSAPTETSSFEHFVTRSFVSGNDARHTCARLTNEAYHRRVTNPRSPLVKPWRFQVKEVYEYYKGQMEECGDATVGLLRASANAEQTTTEGVNPGSGPPASSSEDQEAKQARRAADWKRAETLMENGTLHKGRVDACNNGGTLVRVNGLQGFLPFSQLNPARLTKDGVTRTAAEVGKQLVGDYIRVKVIECNEKEKRLIVSEKQAVLARSIQKVSVGNIFEGVVNSVTDYGAFIDLKFPDGSYPVSGLVHVSELSWDPVPFPRDFIQKGDKVKVKVVQIDRENLKVALSMKQLQADPLLETLDTLMPVESQEDTRLADVLTADAEMTETPLPGLEQIVEFMMQEEGISEVYLGRQALERRVVSQDLELWLSNVPVEDGKFTLLARAGRQVQEVHLNTTLDRDGIKAAVQRVTGKIP